MTDLPVKQHVQQGFLGNGGGSSSTGADAFWREPCEDRVPCELEELLEPSLWEDNLCKGADGADVRPCGSLLKRPISGDL